MSPTESDPPAARRLVATAAESDPATVLVHRDSVVDLPPGSVVDEIYEIDAKLGAGAMGEVYAARHLKLGKRVAIKVIGVRLSEDSAAIERFAQEARALAQIQHPAIVAVDHVGELADGRAYFVMELLRGESLFERIQRGRIPLPEALRILDQMARGLEAAHAHGVTHRDLKPENTFLVRLPGEAPIVKLLDFGLSKLAADVDRRAERTQSGVAIGTPMYMSPEQMRGPNVDHRTDVYALGCVAYEILLGRSPFEHARTVPELFAAHLHEAPPLPRSIWLEIPPQLDLVLFAMLAKNPDHRPTLPQIRSVITTVATTRASTSHHARAAVMPKARRFSKVGTLLIAGAALIGGIVIGAAGQRPSGSAAPRAWPIATYVDAGIAKDALPAVALPTVMIELPPRPHDAGVAHPRDASTVRSVPPKARGTAAVTAPASLDMTPSPSIDVGITVAGPPVVNAPPQEIPAIDAPEKPTTIDVPVHRPTPRPNKPAPLDRNQTLNPFTRKRMTR